MSVRDRAFRLDGQAPSSIRDIMKKHNKNVLSTDFHAVKIALALIAAITALAACGGGGGSGGTPPPQIPQSQTVGGTVSGLAGTGLVLQNNAGDDLAISANGSFVFTTALSRGTAYNVTVKTPPSFPAQNCVLA